VRLRCRLILLCGAHDHAAGAEGSTERWPCARAVAGSLATLCDRSQPPLYGRSRLSAFATTSPALVNRIYAWNGRRDRLVPHRGMSEYCGASYARTYAAELPMPLYADGHGTLSPTCVAPIGPARVALRSSISDVITSISARTIL
jgi:hypothetical protein